MRTIVNFYLGNLALIDACSLVIITIKYILTYIEKKMEKSSWALSPKYSHIFVHLLLHFYGNARRFWAIFSLFVTDAINSINAEIAYNSQIQTKELLKIHCN